MILLKVLAISLSLAVSGQGVLKGTAPAPPIRPFLKKDTASRILYQIILEAEDTRQYAPPFSEKQKKTKPTLEDMVAWSHLGVRRRAAIAIGRIGNPAGLDPLLTRLKIETQPLARADVVFGIGELEVARSVDPLLALLRDADQPVIVRARTVEALGKICSNAGVVSSIGTGRVAEVAVVVAAALPSPSRELSGNDLLLGTMALTALLRLKAPSSVPSVIAQLSAKSSAMRATAANSLARLRPDAAAASSAAGPLTAMLAAKDPVERANGARGLGAIKATASVDAILRLLADPDARVVASAIRVLGTLGDVRAVGPLTDLGERLLGDYRAHIGERSPAVPVAHGRLMLVAEALGLLKQPASLPLLQRIRTIDGKVGANPESEIAVAAFGDEAFFDIPAPMSIPGGAADWRRQSAYAQGLGALKTARAKQELLDMLEGRRFGVLDARAMTETLTALGAAKPESLESLCIQQLLTSTDFYVRATAAGILGEQFAPASEATLNALDKALTASAKDVETDARLAILDAIGKYTSLRSTDLLVSAIADADYLVRRKAAELLEARGAGHFISQIKTASTPVRPRLYYEKLEARMRKPNPTAILQTEKGDVRVELLMREAPMNAMNFIELAQKGYFDGIVYHRVVPNFVVQGGDPRGDGNGGPGYQIRCEINEVPYDRGAVGMALSGKDTGGSQFFFTHAPQPHLDGGYTVFGRVTGGMDVVDSLMRGDRIVKVTILDSGGL